MGKESHEPVVVGQFPTEFEAMLTRNMLVEAGIPAQAVGGMTAGFRAETPGFVKVLVPAEDEEQALKLLIEYTKEAQESSKIMDEAENFDEDTDQRSES